MKKNQPWIIINPNSGGGNALKQKELIVKKAAEMGWQGKYGEITPSKSGLTWVEEGIKAGVRQVIIGGGDGTIRDVLKPVAEGKLTLGIIPLGTGNVLARNLGIPLDIEQAIKVALHGKIQEIDIGVANGNYFGVIAGMGFNVDAMRNTKQIMKGRWGILAYIWTGLRTLTKRGKKYQVVIDGKDYYIFRAKSIVVANMARTVGGIEVAPGAGPQSGDLKVVVVQARYFGSWLDLLVNVLRGEVRKSPYYKMFKAQKVEIYPVGQPRRFECDGDEFPPTQKLEIIFHPKAVKILVPTRNMGSRMVGEKRKILIFDFDGTLADTSNTMVEIYNNLANKYGYPEVDPKQAIELRGHSAREVIEMLKIDKLKIPFMVAEGKNEWEKYQKDVKMFRGMHEVLMKLKAKYGLGIVTSNNVENVNFFLKSNGLQIFDFVYSDKTIFGKGKILINLIGKYDFKPEQLIYVGDEVRDIEAARESGIKVVSVTWGFNTKEILVKHKPDWWVNKPGDLLKIKF